mgnify:CR=1 FL=1
MRRRRKRRNLNKTSLLKIDKDCFVDPGLNMEYVRTILHVCRKYAIKVVWIRSSRSRHGVHFYIRIKPAVEAHVANNLQYLLGDDAKRVAFNRARIESRVAEWNKLFEKPNMKLSTVYRSYSTRVRESDIQVEDFRFAL